MMNFLLKSKVRNEDSKGLLGLYIGRVTLATSYKYNRGGGTLLGLLIILAGVIAASVILNPRTVCENPLKYDIGIIADEFNITSEEFLDTLVKAEGVWEDGTGLELFSYKPGAKFKINLIFDERQRKTIAERRSREALESGGDSYEEVTDKYNSLLSVHNIKVKQYDKDLSAYERRLASYNDEVAYYNGIGGAPKKKYTEIEKERTILENTESKLEQARNELNVLNDKINILVGEVNSLADTYNAEVAQYNNTFGQETTFDQGEYTGTEINVYQFDKISDLKLVLAHEFGHSLNLNHVENPLSIMYYLMEEQSLKLPKLSNEDIAALEVECGL